ncbi:inosine-5-monophosphate dehydrogenase [Fructobacillus pseudoficulneus]|uniref:Inosine-5-monophosphate dehydrogenase n=1 Tax=Fructobacillus pseudoficulneus TaxID=220714 RepID=A0A3F3GVC1_9LACO|nr:IMP dehydrogenase [Fructobacillus pseudoficulneus]GAP02282.1 inosine-5-monophosphate dehydrogenase [Fructobacillus pseudoficulneus]SEH36275.1 IMP dehydrogenase/GMP reductase [Fructobacillus pseudoficulneus]
MTDTNVQHGLGYDETLLVPAASNVLPHMVDLKTSLGDLALNNPLAGATLNPDANATDLVLAIAQSGGLGLVAASEKIADQVAAVEAVKQSAVDLDKNPQTLTDAAGRYALGAEIWLTADVKERALALVDAGVAALFLYLNGDFNDEAAAQIKDLKAAVPTVALAVGTVEDPAVAEKLYDLGVDAVIAGRSINSKQADDIHFPFLTTVMGVAAVATPLQKAVVAQGGIHYSGDVVKALAAGADLVMVSDYLVKEEVPADAVFQIDGGLRAGMGYTGSHTVLDLKEKAQFVQITDNGLKESHPHDVEITKKAPNYVEQERD